MGGAIEGILLFHWTASLLIMSCDPWIFTKPLEIESAAFVCDSEGRKGETKCPRPLAWALHDRCPL